MDSYTLHTITITPPPPHYNSLWRRFGIWSDKNHANHYNPSDPYMRQLFPHYMVFLAALASAALVAMILVYVFLPSKMVFSRAAGCEG